MPEEKAQTDSTTFITECPVKSLIPCYAPEGRLLFEDEHQAQQDDNLSHDLFCL